MTIRTYSSISQLVDLSYKKDSRLVTVQPNQSITYSSACVFDLPPQSVSSTLISIDATQTITNKSMSGASNTFTNISLTSSVTGALPIANGGSGQTTAAAAFGVLSPLTTKGDILTYGTANARIGVGTNGQALVADSSQALGVKWAGVSASAPFVGQTDGTAPASGYLGEVIAGIVSSATSTGANGAYFDATSVAMTSAGIFRIDASYYHLKNGATFVYYDFYFGYSTTSGNSSTDLVDGVNVWENDLSYPVAGGRLFLPIPPIYVRYDGTTITIMDTNTALANGSTIYFKAQINNFSVGTPQYKCKLTATRIA